MPEVVGSFASSPVPHGLAEVVIHVGPAQLLSCLNAELLQDPEISLVFLPGCFSACLGLPWQRCLVKLIDKLGDPGKEVHLGALVWIQIPCQVALEFSCSEFILLDHSQPVPFPLQVSLLPGDVCMDILQLQLHLISSVTHSDLSSGFDMLCCGVPMLCFQAVASTKLTAVAIPKNSHLDQPSCGDVPAILFEYQRRFHPSHFVVGSVTLSVTLSDWPPLENTGNSGSHKMLRTPGFGANLGMKKPGTTEEPG